MRRFAMVLSMVLACSPAVVVAQPAGLEWVPWTGRLPRHAVQGGVDFHGTTPLYLCRARHINGVHPGKLLNSHCHIAWGGKEVVLSRFEVLVWDGPKRYRDDGERWRR